jgi:NitT/TauT family transport system permease protein
MGATAITTAPGTKRPARRFDAARLLPLIGPLVLFAVWDLVVRLHLVSPVLLPTPAAAIAALAKGMAGGPLLGDFLSSLNRTLQAFLIAGVIGVPLGVLLGSS